MKEEIVIKRANHSENIEKKRKDAEEQAMTRRLQMMEKTVQKEERSKSMQL